MLMKLTRMVSLLNEKDDDGDLQKYCRVNEIRCPFLTLAYPNESQESPKTTEVWFTFNSYCMILKGYLLNGDVIDDFVVQLSISSTFYTRLFRT